MIFQENFIPSQQLETMHLTQQPGKWFLKVLELEVKRSLILIRSDCMFHSNNLPNEKPNKVVITKVHVVVSK